MARSSTRASQRRIPARSKPTSAASSVASVEGSSSRAGGTASQSRRSRRAPEENDDAEGDDVSTLASDGNEDIDNGNEDDEDDDDNETAVDEMEVSGRSGTTATRRSTRVGRPPRGAASAKAPPPAKRKTQAKHASLRAQTLVARRSARGRRGRTKAEGDDDGDDDVDDGAAASSDEAEPKSRSKKRAASDGDSSGGEEDAESGKSEDEGDRKTRTDKATKASPRRRGRPPKKRPTKTTEPGSDGDMPGEEEGAGSEDEEQSERDEEGKAKGAAKATPRRRGRPPKIREEVKESKGSESDAEDVPDEDGDDEIKSENNEGGKDGTEKTAKATPRRRGRPPKKPGPAKEEEESKGVGDDRTTSKREVDAGSGDENDSENDEADKRKTETTANVMPRRRGRQPNSKKILPTEEEESKEAGGDGTIPGQEAGAGSGDKNDGENDEEDKGKTEPTANVLPRRRGRQPKTRGPTKDDSKDESKPDGRDDDVPGGDEDAGGGGEHSDEEGKARTETTATVAPRRRGRPPKPRSEITESKATESEGVPPGKVEEAGGATIATAPRRRGRPPRNRDESKDESKKASEAEAVDDDDDEGERGERHQDQIESATRSSTNQDRNDQGDFDADARVGSKRQLPMPQGSSKRIKETSEEEGNEPANNANERRNASADDIVADSGASNVIEISSVDPKKMEVVDDEKQVTVDNREVAAVDALGAVASGSITSLHDVDSKNAAWESPARESDKPAELPIASGDVILEPAEKERTDVVRHSLDTRIPRKAMRRLSSSDPPVASLESGKSANGGGETEIVVCSPKSSSGDPTLGADNAIEGQSRMTIDRGIEDVVEHGAALGDKHVSKAESDALVTTDQQERPRSAETDATLVNASSTSEVAASVTLVLDKPPCERSAEHDADESASKMHVATERIDESGVVDEFTQGNDTEARGKTSTATSGDSPRSTPDVARQEKSAKDQLVEVEAGSRLENFDERADTNIQDTAVPMAPLSLGSDAAVKAVGEADRGEVHAEHNDEQAPDNGGMAQGQQQILETVNDAVDAEMVDSVADPESSTMQALDQSGKQSAKTFVVSSSERLAKPDAPSLVDAGPIKDGELGGTVHSVQQKRSPTDELSAAPEVDVAEAISSRSVSPSNSYGAKESLEPSVRRRPVPAFRVSTPSRTESSTKPGPKTISLERVKTALFSLGCDVHGSSGYERVFAQYWSSFSAVLHGASSLASTLRQHRAIVDSFLKTRRLRKLHNKLVLALLDLYYASSRHLREDSVCPLPNVGEAEVRSQSVSVTSRSEMKYPGRSSLACLTPPFSTSVVDPVSKGSNLKTFPVKASICIPGAMAIDPYVRDVASAAGMNVSENAVWLTVAAMKEFAQTALRNCVQLKLAVESGEVPPMPLIRQRVVHRKRDIGSHHSEVSIGSADTASMNCITAMDVFCLTASMSIGGARSIAGTVSRPAFERALLSSCESRIEPHPEGFDSLKTFIATAISPALLGKVTYDESSSSNPVDTSGVVTSSTVPISTSNPSLKTRAIQGGGGLGRGAKDLGALRARSITQRSATAATVAAPAAASTAPIDIDQNQEQAQAVDPSNAVAQSDTPPEPLEPFQNVSQPPSVCRETDRPPSSEPKSQNVNLARRGKGFGVKNLAAMRARSITKPNESEDDKAQSETPSGENAPGAESPRHHTSETGLPVTTEESPSVSTRSEVIDSSSAAVLLPVESTDPSAGQPTTLTEVIDSSSADVLSPLESTDPSTGQPTALTETKASALSTAEGLRAATDVIISATSEATGAGPNESTASIPPVPAVDTVSPLPNEETENVSTGTQVVSPGVHVLAADEAPSTGGTTPTCTPSMAEAPVPPSGEEGTRGDEVTTESSPTAPIGPAGEEASVPSNAAEPEHPTQSHDGIAPSASSDQGQVPDSVPPSSTDAHPKDASGP